MPSSVDLRVNQLLSEYSNIFRSSLPDELPPARDIEHEIETGDAAYLSILVHILCHCNSSRSRRSRLPSCWKKDWSEKVRLLGVLQSSLSRKRTGLGECVCHRGLNLKTRKNTYPFQWIQDCIDQMGKATHMSTVDPVIHVVPTLFYCAAAAMNASFFFRAWDTPLLMPCGLELLILCRFHQTFESCSNSFKYSGRLHRDVHL